MSRDWTREEFGITDNTPVVDIDSLERKCERLQKQLEIAVEVISMIDKRKIYMCNCLKGCPLKKYYEKNNGCATCVSNACHKALKQIRELNK